MLVENFAQRSDFAYTNVVKVYRELMYPFSTRENDDDRDAIVSDRDLSEGSDGEGNSGIAMYAAFDRAREQPESVLSLLGRSGSRRGALASVAGDMLTSSSSGSSGEDSDASAAVSGDDGGGSGSNTYRVGQRVYVRYDDGEVGGATVFSADIIETSRKTVTVCYETDGSTEKINDWAYVNRFVSERVYDSELRKLERRSAKKSASRWQRQEKEAAAKAEAEAASSNSSNSSSGHDSNGSDSEMELEMLESPSAVAAKQAKKRDLQTLLGEDDDDVDEDLKDKVEDARLHTRASAKRRKREEEENKRKSSRKRFIMSSSSSEEEEEEEEDGAAVMGQVKVVVEETPEQQRRRMLSTMLDDDDEDED